MLTIYGLIAVVAAVSVTMNFRPAYMTEKVALEIACSVMASRHDGTPQMQGDCAIYSLTGWVRRDFE